MSETPTAPASGECCRCSHWRTEHDNYGRCLRDCGCHTYDPAPSAPEPPASGECHHPHDESCPCPVCGGWTPSPPSPPASGECPTCKHAPHGRFCSTPCRIDAFGTKVTVACGCDSTVCVPAPSAPERGRMSDQATRPCSVCRTVLPIETGFYRDKRAADGRRSDCKNCDSKHGKIRRSNRKDAIRAYDRAYRQALPVEKKREMFRRQQKKRQPKRTAAQRHYRAAHPERPRAHHAVRKAVVGGSLARPEACERCGAKGGRIEASHYDYARPLFVEWLCVKCHRTKDGFPGYGGDE